MHSEQRNHSEIIWIFFRTVIRSINPFALSLSTNNPSYFSFLEVVPYGQSQTGLYTCSLHLHLPCVHQGPRGHSFGLSSDKQCPVSSMGWCQWHVSGIWALSFPRALLGLLPEGENLIWPWHRCTSLGLSAHRGSNSMDSPHLFSLRLMFGKVFRASLGNLPGVWLEQNHSGFFYSGFYCLPPKPCGSQCQSLMKKKGTIYL